MASLTDPAGPQGVDPALLGRLWLRTERPGCVRHGQARSILARHGRMIDLPPLAELLLRRGVGLADAVPADLVPERPVVAGVRAAMPAPDADPPRATGLSDVPPIQTQAPYGDRARVDGAQDAARSSPASSLAVTTIAKAAGDQPEVTHQAASDQPGSRPAEGHARPERRTATPARQAAAPARQAAASASTRPVVAARPVPRETAPPPDIRPVPTEPGRRPVVRARDAGSGPRPTPATTPTWPRPSPKHAEQAKHADQADQAKQADQPKHDEQPTHADQAASRRSVPVVREQPPPRTAWWPSPPAGQLLATLPAAIAAAALARIAPDHSLTQPGLPTRPAYQGTEPAGQRTGEGTGEGTGQRTGQRTEPADRRPSPAVRERETARQAPPRIDMDRIVGTVQRRLMHQLAIERERRGATR